MLSLCRNGGSKVGVGGGHEDGKGSLCFFHAGSQETSVRNRLGASLVSPVTNWAGEGDGGVEVCSGNSLLIVLSLV